MGQVAIKELDQALSSFKYPDGKAEIFKFVLTPDLVPTLTFTDKSKQTTVYTWDPATDHLVSEEGPQGNWLYKVGAISQQYGVPPISRVSPDNKTEMIAIDQKKGTYTRQMPDGTTLITHIFETPGPLYQKVRNIEKITGKTTTLIYSASYDEMGHLIREVDGGGHITKLTYDSQGNLRSSITSLSTDPEILEQLNNKGRQLTDKIASSTSTEDKQNAIRNLVQYYLFDMLDYTKAKDLISQLDHKHAFVVLVQSIGFDQTTSSEQKVAAYQSLLKDYPEYKERLDFLINATKGK
jgi:YD repeat-containing protein